MQPFLLNSSLTIFRITGLPHVLELLEMFLKLKIPKSVIELQKTPCISEKIQYLKRLLNILSYSTIFPNIIEQLNFIYMLKLSPETEF